MLKVSVLPIAVAISLLTACAGAPTPAQVRVPGAIAVPSGASPYLELLATGVQIYVCTRKSDASYEWAFKAPEATLASRSGVPAGTHYAGPTWQAPDGSTVVGEVRARDPGPTTSAIPWLLLAAKSNTGSGAFGATKFIQRLETAAGTAPTTSCGADNVDAVARVPYTATYAFFR